MRTVCKYNNYDYMYMVMLLNLMIRMKIGSLDSWVGGNSKSKYNFLPLDGVRRGIALIFTWIDQNLTKLL